MQRVITDDLDALLNALPPHISEPVHSAGERGEFLEVVMDLGRPPEARYLMPNSLVTLNAMYPK